MMLHSALDFFKSGSSRTRNHPFRSRSLSPRSVGRKLFLEPLETRNLLAAGLSESLVALGGATPLPLALPLQLAASPFGGPDIYQNFMGPADAPPVFGNDPNQLTNFNGFFGGVRLQGVGVGTEVDGSHNTYLWDADLRFMQGVYRAVDGNVHRGTFVEVWIDLYQSQSDFLNGANQLHDFNNGFGPAVSAVDSGNGFGTRVLWTAAVPDSDVQIDLDAGTAALHVRDLRLYDYPTNFADGSLGPNWQTAALDATVSFDVAWGGPVTRQVKVKDTTYGFAGTFQEDQATVTWSGRNASGFSFVSDVGSFDTSIPEIPGVNGVVAPLNFFAEIGRERNGVFFPGSSSSTSGNSALAPAVVDSIMSGQPVPQPAKAQAWVSAPSPTGGQIPAWIVPITPSKASAISMDPGGSDSPPTSSDLGGELLLR
jgi:hypothetical protein